MHKEILRLSIPNIISNITIPLLGIVDLALMGHLGSEIYIGAIAVGGVIFNIIYWGFSFLRMSTSGFTAQAFGKQNYNETSIILIRSVVVALVIGFLLLLLQKPIEWLCFLMINGSPEVELYAREYFRIRVWAAPASLALFSTSGWFLGMQNARYPMIIAIAVNIINILLSVFFVYFLNMESDGVALGTVIAQYGGLIIAVFLFQKKYKFLTLAKIKILQIIELKSLADFFKVNANIFIRTLCIVAVFTFFTSKSASLNDTTLAVNSLLLQLLLLFSFFIDGFAFAGEALVGKYIGSNKPIELRKVVKLLLYWGAGLAFLFTLAYSSGIELFLKLLTNSINVIEAANPYTIWIVFIPLASFLSFIWDGIYIGATASKAMRNSLLISTIGIFAPVYFFTSPYLHNHALWLAMVLFMAFRGIILTFLYKSAVLSKIST